LYVAEGTGEKEALPLILYVFTMTSIELYIYA